MTKAQFDTLMNGKDFKKDVVYILAAENTKINSTRFAKVEADDDFLRAYILHPNSTEENPIYVESFVMSMDNVLGVQFKNGFGNDLLNNLQNSMLTDY